MTDEAICEFLQQECAIGILVRLDANDGMRNGELHDKVHISSTTLSKRLNEGLDAGLVTITRHPDDHGNAKRYQLTTGGERVIRRMERLEMVDLYPEFFAVNQELDEKTEELVNWIQESPHQTDWLPGEGPEGPSEHE